MKKLWGYAETIFDVICMIAFNVAVNTYFGGVLGIVLTIIFVIVVNIFRLHRNKMLSESPLDNSVAPVIPLPGNFTIMAQADLGVDLNGRVIQFHKGEGVEVRVPETCSAVAFRFIDRETPDDILNATTLEGIQ